MVTRVTRSESALDGGDCEDYLEADAEREDFEISEELGTTWSAAVSDWRWCARRDSTWYGVRAEVRGRHSEGRGGEWQGDERASYWALDGVERLHCRTEEAEPTATVGAAHCVGKGGGSVSERSLVIESV
ncbi:hypothetical protein F442_12703 [Phytophthora nicotianae P10297]|uniref:Uncharacterized protein n=1 Tax=Phytophthora nicotianae P10297 TaxID=1317064 RepID=W2Z0Y5_PHYNI|nr:hypothetical protein F442_12703 [Phytophthora nicotianae P10297]